MFTHVSRIARQLSSTSSCGLVPEQTLQAALAALHRPLDGGADVDVEIYWAPEGAKWGPDQETPSGAILVATAYYTPGEDPVVRLEPGWDSSTLLRQVLDRGQFPASGTGAEVLEYLLQGCPAPVAPWLRLTGRNSPDLLPGQVAAVNRIDLAHPREWVEFYNGHKWAVVATRPVGQGWRLHPRELRRGLFGAYVGNPEFAGLCGQAQMGWLQLPSVEMTAGHHRH